MQMVRNNPWAYNSYRKTLEQYFKDICAMTIVIVSALLNTEVKKHILVPVLLFAMKCFKN